MRDAKMTTGPKRYTESFDDIQAAVRAVYPKTRREGSVGCWSWAADGWIVAEAWVHPTKPGWSYRIKPADAAPTTRAEW